MADIPVFGGGSKKVTPTSTPQPGAPLSDLPTWRPGMSTSKPHDPQGGPVKAWSASGLKQFEACPYSIKLKKVDRKPDPSGEAADRGTRIHQEAEDYVRGKLDELPPSMAKFKGLCQQLRERYAEGHVELEGDWGFDINWQQTEYFGKRIWLRAKLDVLHWQDETSVQVIDWKSGKKFGNEFTHAQQGLIYAIATFMRFSQVQFVEVTMIYVDHGETLIQRYTRAQALALKPRLHKRAEDMTSCTTFKPKPSQKNCRFCNFGKSIDGAEPACAYRYET